MELDRSQSHIRNTTTNELLICFSSSSSSSMKLTKSILSPGRAALSSSLSRRLRTNGSLKGGASPFFPTKKRVSGFDNPEPSSPKVTCIGQVRVKTKKKVRQQQTRRRSSGSGEVSFRKIQLSNTKSECFPQSFVSICEGLKSISCFSTEKDQGDGCYVEENRVSFRRSSRRHVFDDFVVMDDVGEEDFQVEKGRMSVCTPPKNALLLMRCRSDPMKVAALASRFRSDARDDEDPLNRENDGDVEEMDGVCDENKEFFVSEFEREDENFVEHGDDVLVESSEKEAESNEMEDDGYEELIVGEGLVVENMVEDELYRRIVDANREDTFEEVDIDEGEEEVESNMSSFEDLLEQENADQPYEDCPIQDEERIVAGSALRYLSPSVESDLGKDIESIESESDFPIFEEDPLVKSNNNATNDEKYQPQIVPEEPKPNNDQELQNEKPQKGNKTPTALPECLLLMMCEPKLSMEVSKETWVCRTDFIRWQPEHPSKQQQPDKRRLSTDSKPKQLEKMINILHQPAMHQAQPPRSSCSLPPKALSMATMIEQKLVNAMAYEPFVLTRCKSEPMRTAATKLMPDSFYWKNAMKKLEPHRRATVVRQLESAAELANYTN